MSRILLVDDEPDFLEVLEASLKELGFDITTADSGVDALAKLKDNKDIDCILSDYYMPQMRGDELAMMIRHQSETPVIIMTSDPNVSYEKVYRSGVSGVMTKPIDAELFAEFLKANDLLLHSDANKQRKFLRKLHDTSGMSLTISNGKQTIPATISNLSTQGLGLRLNETPFSLTTVQFSIEKGSEQVKGFMHCRWKSSDPSHINAGFEFDSITKKDLSKSDVFYRWINN